MGNRYLESLEERYSELRSSIEALLNRAIEDNREVTADEKRSIEEMGESCKSLLAQMEPIAEMEQRNRKVAELSAELLTEQTEQGQQNRSSGAGGQQPRAGVVYTQDRDPGHYTRNSQNSFFGDMYRSRVFGDELASRRIVEHQRALSTGAEGAGVVPPNWLTAEFEQIARQGRAAANAVRSIPLGDDPRPLTLPKQVGASDVAEQVAENDAVHEEVPGWDSDVDTVTPKATAGKQIVSRQMLDMSSPAIDQLIFGDLTGAYNTKVEKRVTDAIMAAGPAALSASPRGGPNTAGDDQFDDQTLEAAIRVRNVRKAAADVTVMSIRRYGEFLKLKDNDGRPLIPNPGTGQAVNVIGVGSVAVDGLVHGLGIIASDQVTDAGDDTDTFAVLRASDVLLFESNLLRFRFEEQAGPESIVLGVWGYVATLVRQGASGIQRITVNPV